MKRKIIIILVFTFIGFSSCQKLEIEKDTPKCIENLINDFDKEQTCESGVSVKKYTFQEKTVYVFDPGTCGADMTSTVIDFDCNSLGFLGGISGNTEINGENFSNATFESTTWKR
ncbi:MAG: hypothetical protein COA97_00550 [Flavobacteriales bacterium]|nr:MAG: hypothetical protein COA97_00550 [Flavobacteriales bacterium]